MPPLNTTLVPAVKLVTPVLLIVKDELGPALVKLVTLIPVPAVGVTLVTTELPFNFNADVALIVSNVTDAVVATLCGIDITPLISTEIFEPTSNTPCSVVDQNGNRYDILFPYKMFQRLPANTIINEPFVPNVLELLPSMVCPPVP